MSLDLSWQSLHCESWPAGLNSGATLNHEEHHARPPPQSGAPPRGPHVPPPVPLSQLWERLPTAHRLPALQALGRMLAQRLPILHQTREVKDERR